MPHAAAQAPRTGICILNYQHPDETSLCVASLLVREPVSSRILWIENDANRTREALMACLAKAPFPWMMVDPGQDQLPPAGTVGVIPCPDNLGYAGGNNVGLRFLHRHGVPFAWVLNNDTELVAGNSDLLAEASRAQPEVGAWGTVILTDHQPQYFGGIVKTRDFAIALALTPEALADPLAFVSGCSLFMPLATAAEVGFLPEDYFLYYEDPSFSLLLKRAGYRLGGLWTVTVRHLESLSTGRRSPLMEYYSLRNRWFFIERFFPGHLAGQKRRLWYALQKYLLRGRPWAAHTVWVAYQDYKQGRLGRTSRNFSRLKRP
jgi:GT2 family glycosyltransferase